MTLITSEPSADCVNRVLTLHAALAVRGVSSVYHPVEDLAGVRIPLTDVVADEDAPSLTVFCDGEQELDPRRRFKVWVWRGQIAGFTVDSDEGLPLNNTTLGWCESSAGVDGLAEEIIRLRTLLRLGVTTTWQLVMER